MNPVVEIALELGVVFAVPTAFAAVWRIEEFLGRLDGAEHRLAVLEQLAHPGRTCCSGCHDQATATAAPQPKEATDART